MPEFMGHKISQSEYKARHAYRRALDKALRVAARGTGWKCAGGQIFQDNAGWFISAAPSVIIYWRETRVSLTVKPMGIDRVFWDIVRTPENHSLPLSFRANGAWTCRPPPFSESTVDEVEMDARLVAEHVVAWASSEAKRVNDEYRIDDYLNFLTADGRAKGSHLAVLVSTLILAGRSDEAEALCRDAQKRGDDAGYVAFPLGGFPSMTLTWLESHAKPVVH